MRGKKKNKQYCHLKDNPYLPDSNLSLERITVILQCFFYAALEDCTDLSDHHQLFLFSPLDRATI